MAVREIISKKKKRTRGDAPKCFEMESESPEERSNK